MDLSLNIEGLDQLQANLKALPIELQGPVLTDSLMPGAQIIADRMSELAPRGKDTGPREKNDQHLADSIAIQAEKKPIGSGAEVYVGPNKAVAWRARFNEFGTTVHEIINKRAAMFGKAKKVLASPQAIFGSKVEHPGEKPQPFMRQALDEAGQEAVTAIKDALAVNIKTAAAKVNRK
jgi:HK97 gp10 family phage protein